MRNCPPKTIHKMNVCSVKNPMKEAHVLSNNNKVDDDDEDNGNRNSNNNKRMVRLHSFQDYCIEDNDSVRVSRTKYEINRL